MIHYHRQTPDTDEFKAWRDRCEKAVQALWKTYRSAKALCSDDINGNLYKEFKDEIFTGFRGKCAFCESLIRDLDQPGDVEHYRPKLGIKDENENSVMVRMGFRKVPHPGYFWLAYAWENLIPSCNLCNRAGKKNYFPVEPPGAYATNKDGLVKEHPLLINPAVDDPSDHLELDRKDFYLKEKTERGKKTIDILKLNRSVLVEQRKATYLAVWSLLYQDLTAMVMNRNAPVINSDVASELEEHRAMKRSYTLAALAAIGDFDKRLAARVAARTPAAEPVSVT
jgi:hypothetical protein